jgi:Skp family chaperone for outer membrane proteins
MNKLILGLAVIGMMASCGAEEKEDKEKAPKESAETSLKIAYYDLEKMYTDLDFSISAGKQLEAEMTAANEDYGKYSKQYENSMAVMQDPNASIDQQMAADRRMQIAQKKLTELQQASGWQMKQMQLEQQLAGYLFQFSEEYAKQIGVDALLVNAPGGTIAYINKSYDVSDDFVKFLNEKIGSGVQTVSPNAQGQPLPAPAPAQ